METRNMTVGELRELLAVPESGTAREQIVYIDVADLEPDPRNFYSLSDIDGLMENISLFGVQQPLRVRADPMDPDKWIIVSGHRRREAVRRLAEDGREDLREVPCIIETAAGSEALQELRLIYANSDTRRMTSAEISSQAERVEALLYQLKEEGFDFPGRMRDHVAEACKVSKSKLARLKVIEKNLIPVFLAAWKEGELNEDQAYTLARMSPEMQMRIDDHADGGDKASWTSRQLGIWHDRMSRILEMKCPASGRPRPCDRAKERIAGVFDETVFICGDACCRYCFRLADCDDSCRKCADKKEQLLAAKAEMEAQRSARQSEKDQEKQETLTRLWKRVGEIWRASGVDKREAWMVLNNEEPDEDDLREFVTLANSPEESVTAQSPVPILYYSLVAEDLQDLCGIADFFHCSLDYLLGRTDKREVNR